MSAIRKFPKLHNFSRKFYWAVVNKQNSLIDFSSEKNINSDSLIVNWYWTINPSDRSKEVILIVTQDLPLVDRTGHYRRFLLLARILQKLGFMVIVSPINDKKVTVRNFNIEDNLESYESMLRDEGIYFLYPQDLNESIYNLSSKLRCIWFYGQQQLESFLSLKRGAIPLPLVILDTVDLEYRRAEQFGLINQANELKSKLYAAYKYANFTFFISENELNQFYNDFNIDAPSGNCHVLSNIYPIDDHKYLAMQNELNKIFDGLFVGAFSHQPNIDGIAWFLEEIIPQVKKGRFLIVGEGLPSYFQTKIDNVNLNRTDIMIEYAGHVEDINHVYLSSRFAIAPLRKGAGVKGKVIEALSFGLPVVGTTIAFEGIGSINDSSLHFAEDSKTFGDRINALVELELTINNVINLEKNINILKKFSIETASEKLKEVLDV